MKKVFSSHTRKVFFLAVLLAVFSAFTADVLDLREDLRFFSCSYSFLDNNITTAVIGSPTLDAMPLIALRSIDQKSSVEISFLFLLPYAFRAPPLPTRS